MLGKVSFIHSNLSFPGMGSFSRVQTSTVVRRDFLMAVSMRYMCPLCRGRNLPIITACLQSIPIDYRGLGGFYDRWVIKVQRGQLGDNNYQMEKKYLTAKCNHNERGRCINCLNNRLKMEKEMARNEATEKPRALFETKSPEPVFNKCQHGPGAKCINCLPKESIIIQKCNHSPVIKCSHCIEKEYYTTFKEYLQRLDVDCTHNKPCPQCVPPQRMHYFVDRTCRRHLPYPQAMCNLCMPPVVSVGKQSYTHVKEVIFQTFDVFKVIEKRDFLGFLYGNENNGVIDVKQLYFPGYQLDSKTGIFNIVEDKNESNVALLTQALGLKLVGIIYDSVDLLHWHLSLSAHYQQMNKTLDCNTQVSKLVTVRIIRDPETFNSEGIQCFMVSDQFQTFQRNSLTYPLPHHNEFGLQVAMSKYDNLPTYLRAGIETDRIQFGECMVWVPFRQEDSLNYEEIIEFPFYGLEHQSFADFQQYVEIMKTITYIFRYRNLQFLLYLSKFKGIPFVYSLLVCESEEQMMKLERQIDGWIVEEKSRRAVAKMKQEEPDIMNYNRREESSRGKGNGERNRKTERDEFEEYNPYTFGRNPGGTSYQQTNRGSQGQSRDRQINQMTINPQSTYFSPNYTFMPPTNTNTNSGNNPNPNYPPTSPTNKNLPKKK